MKGRATSCPWVIPRWKFPLEKLQGMIKIRGASTPCRKPRRFPGYDIIHLIPSWKVLVRGGMSWVGIPGSCWNSVVFHGPLGDLQNPSKTVENSWDVFPWFLALGEAGWRKSGIPHFWDLSRKSHYGTFLRDVGMGITSGRGEDPENKRRHNQG